MQGQLLVRQPKQLHGTVSENIVQSFVGQVAAAGCCKTAVECYAKAAAFGWRLRNVCAALRGAMVWLLDGPVPIR